jgi:hypothetical protein
VKASSIRTRKRSRTSRLAAIAIDFGTFLLAGACGSALPTDTPLPTPPAQASTAPRPIQSTDQAVSPKPPVLAKTAAASKPCRDEMAHVAAGSRDYCIDRWEASLVRRDGRGGEMPWPDSKRVDGVVNDVVAVSRPNVMPQGYIDERQAARACTRGGKRLCRLDEWRTACKGPKVSRFPYGNGRRARACNDHEGSERPHPVVQLFNRAAPPGTSRSEMWGVAWMNDPRLHDPGAGLLPTGASPDCTNEFGVFDMVGNLHEWVDDPSGSFAGGFFMDTRLNGEGCDYLTTAHAPTYHDYSTGFRCCADASE